MKTCANPNCTSSFAPKSHIHAFCSKHCAKAARGSDYRRARDEALWRDGFACTQCGAESPLECHHRTPLCRGGDHTLGNLQTLCRPCHKEKHRNWRKNGETTRRESEVND